MTTIPPFAVTALLAFARRIMCTEPSQVLGPDGDPYLMRWWLEKDREQGSVYVHRMLRSDRDLELHDHPGDNLSIVLEGEMREHTLDGVVVRRPGDMVTRSADTPHRIEIDAPLVTLWIMGERIREWGFWETGPEGRVFVPSQTFFEQRGYY